MVSLAGSFSPVQWFVKYLPADLPLDLGQGSSVL